MKTKFRFLFLVFTLLIGHTSFGDNIENENAKMKGGSIAGRVVDQEGLPLPGATVVIKSVNVGVISDAYGFYRINRLEDGIYEVEVSYIGFKNTSAKLTTKTGKVTEHDFVIEAGIDIDEVVVNGAIQGQSKALNQQRNSINVTNVISSDQVGRFPDQNVGDALKRIPGINVQYDQGEARFGHVRGLAPEYNSVTIDGDRIPSAEAETRSVQLDLIPSDMVQSIEVSKVVTPEMDGDAIGGSINLVTKSNPYKQRIAGSVGATYNALTGKPAANFGLIYGNRIFNDKLGYTLAASVQDHKLGSDDIEAEWDEDGQMTDFQIRTYLVQRLRQSYSAALDYEFNPNHKIEAKVMYNHRNDWENRYRLRYKDLDKGVAKVERELKAGSSENKSARLEDQRTFHVAFGGEHQLGVVEMDWKGSYAKASETRPHERYLTYVMKKVNFTQDVSDTRKPKVIINTADAQDFNANWGFDEMTEEFQYTDDIDKNFKVDFKLPIAEGVFANSLKVGLKYKGKSKQRDNDFYDVSPVNEDQFNADAMDHLIDVTKDSYLPGDQYNAGTFVDREYLGNLDLASSDYTREQNLEELAGNFNASEDIAAAYLRFDQKVGKLDLVVGARFENTAIAYKGKKLKMEEIENEEGEKEEKITLDETAEANSSYNNFLPSLLLKYNFSKDSKLKLAYSNTIARPKYIGLVPRVEINNEDNEISIGNPDLIPTTSMNFDLMYENYFQSIGIFSAGVFYKNMKDFIAEVAQNDFVYNGNKWDKFTQYVNAGDATILGFELALQRQFDFLPGFLKQTGFYTNYTYTNSTVTESNVEDREADELSLPGTPTHNFNASLYYEGEKLSARASFNFASDFIDEFGGEAFEDRYYDKVTYLDLNASYQINKSFVAYVEANNLLNQPLRYYQGSPEFMMQDEYYNVRINLGVKFNF